MTLFKFKQNIIYTEEDQVHRLILDRQVAGQDTEYEQNEGDIITNLHYINNVDKVEVTYKFTINGK